MPELRELAATHGSAQDRLRLAFLDEGNAFDAALDLSISHLREGKTAEPMAALLLSRKPPGAKPPPPSWPAKLPYRSTERAAEVRRKAG